MESRWSRAEAPDDALERRLYGSRLIGAERSLVLRLRPPHAQSTAGARSTAPAAAGRG